MRPQTTPKRPACCFHASEKRRRAPQPGSPEDARTTDAPAVRACNQPGTTRWRQNDLMPATMQRVSDDQIRQMPTRNASCDAPARATGSTWWRPQSPASRRPRPPRRSARVRRACCRAHRYPQFQAAFRYRHARNGPAPAHGSPDPPTLGQRLWIHAATWASAA